MSPIIPVAVTLSHAEIFDGFELSCMVLCRIERATPI